jgi:hypothetical protein
MSGIVQLVGAGLFATAEQPHITQPRRLHLYP